MFGIVVGNGTRAYMRHCAFRPNADAGCVRRHAKPVTRRKPHYNEGKLWRIDDVRMLRRMAKNALRRVEDPELVDIMLRYRRPEPMGW